VVVEAVGEFLGDDVGMLQLSWALLLSFPPSASVEIRFGFVSRGGDAE